MSDYKYDFLVFIGRFQPVHIGHLEVIKKALTLAENAIILVGSANQPRTIKNPWTYSERADMISESLHRATWPKTDTSRLLIRPLHDQKYNDQKWAASVQEQVDNAIQHVGSEQALAKIKVGIIGHSKDESSYYLKMFPQWDLIEHEMNEAINATDLRDLMFEGKNIKFLQALLTPYVYQQLEKFTSTADFAQLVKQYQVIKKYKKAWQAAPYAPIFVTVDAVVVQSGHVLLVQRDAEPGEGLWAMPGGFLEQGEYVKDGIFRELDEETQIKVAPAALRGSLKMVQVYDRPDRSMRGRTITHAGLIKLPDGPLAKVKGSDDARDAKWVKIADLREDNMFEDHFHVLMDLLGKL